MELPWHVFQPSRPLSSPTGQCSGSLATLGLPRWQQSRWRERYSPPALATLATLASASATSAASAMTPRTPSSRTNRSRCSRTNRSRRSTADSTDLTRRFRWQPRRPQSAACGTNAIADSPMRWFAWFCALFPANTHAGECSGSPRTSWPWPPCHPPCPP